jgi:uncharacterized damage-inducible protein DinB
MSPAKRRAAGRSRAKRAAVRAAKPAAGRRGPKGTGRVTKPAPMSASKRAKRPPAAKRAASKPAPGLRLVRSPARRAKRSAAPATPPAFPQRQGASPKQLLRFALVRAWTRVLAATQGLSAASGERPSGAGKWTLRETVLHLHAWDLEWERALEPAARGVRPVWMTHGPGELAILNQRLLAPLRHLPWDEAVRRLQMSRTRLLEAIESLPEEPAVLWTQEHPLGELLASLPEHDHHHAEIIKRARAEAPPQPRTP